MENDDMASKQNSSEGIIIRRISLGIAITMFVMGLVLYIARETTPQSPASKQLMQEPSDVAPTTKPEWVEGQVIIKFRPGVTDEQITERLRPLNASIKSIIEDIQATVISVPPGQEEAILNELARDPLVLYAEPDYIYHLELTPNDPEFAKQWGLKNTGQTLTTKTGSKKGKVDADINADSAWDVSKGTGVKVAILDSGIDQKHPDLASKVILTKVISTTSINDLNGHGTHVAGILAANVNNGIGVAGVCPECQLIIGKIANDDGSVPTSAISAGVTWAADNGAQVINMSVAGRMFAQSVQDAVNYAWGKNIVIVSAAGNQGTNSKHYPAGYKNVVAVANTTMTDTRSNSSNFGTWVHVAAPGETIYSTLPTTTNRQGGLNYGALTGTSMASPAVAGAAALVWKSQYGTNNAAVVKRLFDTADKITGTGSQWVYGRINVAKAVGANPAPSVVPSAAMPSPAASLVPSFVCGGSTNSICPKPSDSQSNNSQSPGVSIPPQASIVPSSGANIPGGTDNGNLGIPNGSFGDNGSGGSGFHMKKSEGLIGAFIKLILLFFLLLFGVLGNGGLGR